MSRSDKQTPQSSHRATQDMQLVQILQETHRMAVAHADDESWRALGDRTAGLLQRIGAPSDDASPASPATEHDRIDRGAIELDAHTADRVAASLMALADQPDERQLGLAQEALRDLETYLGR